jgi:putative flippase GtrA
VLQIALVFARPLANTVSFALAVTNGFYWNSRWTFRRPEREGRSGRYARFVATNLIGLALNQTILNLVAHVVPVSITSLLAGHLHDPAGFVGKVCATGVVLFWNFLASKYWTFKS